MALLTRIGLDMKLDNALMLGGEFTGLSLSRGSLIAAPQKGQLSISDNLGLQTYTGAAWQAVASTIDMLYEFTTYTFRALTTGPNGSTLAQFRAAYPNQPWTNLSGWFNVVAGIQAWTVPVGGVYEIVATAPGNSQNGLSYSGSQVTVQVVLGKGDIVRFLCGQVGGGSSNQAALCGSGGTFVVSQARGILAVAGGAAGGASASASARGNAVTNLAAAGSGGYGASGSYSTINTSSFSSGGAGYSGSSDGYPGAFAYTASTPGIGGGGVSGQNFAQYGGFGGGGGGIGNAYGGGGGYTGGSGGGQVVTSSQNSGFGGTCYAPAIGNGVTVRSAIASQATNGTVKITLKQLTTS